MDTSRLRNRLVSLFLLLIVMGKPASAQADGMSDECFAKLARGINLPYWFWYAPEADRALWIHDTRTAFEKYGVGWAM